MILPDDRKCEIVTSVPLLRYLEPPWRISRVGGIYAVLGCSVKVPEYLQDVEYSSAAARHLCVLPRRAQLPILGP